MVRIIGLGDLTTIEGFKMYTEQLKQQREANIDLLIQYVNTFPGCKAYRYKTDGLIEVESMFGQTELIPATLDSVQDWLRA